MPAFLSCVVLMLSAAPLVSSVDSGSFTREEQFKHHHVVQPSDYLKFQKGDVAGLSADRRKNKVNTLVFGKYDDMKSSLRLGTNLPPNERNHTNLYQSSKAFPTATVSRNPDGSLRELEVKKQRFVAGLVAKPRSGQGPEELVPVHLEGKRKGSTGEPMKVIGSKDKELGIPLFINNVQGFAPSKSGTGTSSALIKNGGRLSKSGTIKSAAKVKNRGQATGFKSGRKG